MPSQRGRKSAAALAVAAVVKPATGFGRLRPPAELGEAEAEVWREIVGACDARHFERSDMPLLVEYCTSVVLARLAAAALQAEGPVVNGRPSAWIVIQEKAQRAMVALSMRLRISPQARMRREGTAPKGPGASPYELMDGDDEPLKF